MDDTETGTPQYVEQQLRKVAISERALSQVPEASRAAVRAKFEETGTAVEGPEWFTPQLLADALGGPWPSRLAEWAQPTSWEGQRSEDRTRLIEAASAALQSDERDDFVGRAVLHVRRTWTAEG